MSVGSLKLKIVVSSLEEGGRVCKVKSFCVSSAEACCVKCKKAFTLSHNFLFSSSYIGTQSYMSFGANKRGSSFHTDEDK